MVYRLVDLAKKSTAKLFIIFTYSIKIEIVDCKKRKENEIRNVYQAVKIMKYNLD